MSDGAEERPEKAWHLHGPVAENGIPAAAPPHPAMAAGLPGEEARPKTAQPPALPLPAEGARQQVQPRATAARPLPCLQSASLRCRARHQRRATTPVPAARPLAAAAPHPTTAAAPPLRGAPGERAASATRHAWGRGRHRPPASHTWGRGPAGSASSRPAARAEFKRARGPGSGIAGDARGGAVPGEAGPRPCVRCAATLGLPAQTAWRRRSERGEGQGRREDSSLAHFLVLAPASKTPLNSSARPAATPGAAAAVVPPAPGGKCRGSAARRAGRYQDDHFLIALHCLPPAAGARRAPRLPRPGPSTLRLLSISME